MTDRTYSPSGWGGVPERIDWSVCHCGRNADGSLKGYCAHCSSVRCDAYPGACSPPPEPAGSPDLPIPTEAIEAAAKAACEATYPPSPDGRAKAHASWNDIEDWERGAWFRTAEAALAAALPHLQVAALDILSDLIDRNGCHFDHTGGCQEHGWLHESKRCPHARAKDLLGKGDPS